MANLPYTAYSIAIAVNFRSRTLKYRALENLQLDSMIIIMHPMHKFGTDFARKAISDLTNQIKGPAGRNRPNQGASLRNSMEQVTLHE